VPLRSRPRTRKEQSLDVAITRDIPARIRRAIIKEKQVVDLCAQRQDHYATRGGDAQRNRFGPKLKSMPSRRRRRKSRVRGTSRAKFLSRTHERSPATRASVVHSAHLRSPAWPEKTPPFWIYPTYQSVERAIDALRAKVFATRTSPFCSLRMSARKILPPKSHESS